MTLICLAVRIDIECRTCAAPVAMAGLGQRARCPGCDTEIELEPEFLEDVLSQELDRRGELEPPLFRTKGGMGAFGYCRTSYGLQAPRCACGQELPLASLAGAPPEMPTADDRTIVCTACQASTMVRRRFPPERMGHELARGLLLEHRPAPRLEEGGAICVWCPREVCRDAMGLTEYAQRITCDSCGCPFELERARWDHLTTLAGARHFYLVLEEEEAPAPQPEAKTLPLNLGWVASETLIVPALILLLTAMALVDQDVDRAIVGAVVVLAGLIIAIRLPLLLRTLFGERDLVLGDDALRVPIVGLFQLRPWVIPYRDIVSISLPRRSGGSTKVAIALRDGRMRKFSATVVEDRYALVHAIERRIGAPG